MRTMANGIGLSLMIALILVPTGLLLFSVLCCEPRMYP